MNIKKEIHYSGLLTDGKLHDQKIQDCQIVGIQCEAIEAVHCVFQNVIFKSSFMGTMVFVKNCEFIDCVFQDIFENTELYVADNVFKDCLFEGININDIEHQSGFNCNLLYGCNFKNIKITANIEVNGNKMQGGSMEDFWCLSNVWESELSHIKMKNVTLKASTSGTKMEDILFENVSIESPGSMVSGDLHIMNCNAHGLTLIMDTTLVEREHILG